MKDKNLKPLLIGILIDVSSSMQRNWKNQEGKTLPKIEVIRDALNRQILKISSLSSQNKRSIDIFCLGMGFKQVMYFSETEIKYGYENSLNKKLKIRTNLSAICDILALNEIIPSKSELVKLDKALNKKWRAYAEHVINQIKIPSDIDKQLQDFIYHSLRETALLRLQKTWAYKIFQFGQNNNFIVKYSVLGWIFDHLSNYIINIWTRNIDKKSLSESKRYIEDMLAMVTDNFNNYESQYENLIKNTLNDFASEQTKLLVNLLTLGYPASKISDCFDEKKVEALAKQIYERLKKDVEKSMKEAWTLNRLSLWWTSLDLRAEVDSQNVKNLTEQCVNKFSWDKLRPFVENTVKDLFVQNLQNHVTKKLPDWLRLASSREVVRSIKEVTNILPDALNESVYSNEFMFGATPMEEAMNRISFRFVDKSHKNRKKILLIISDGEFESNNYKNQVNFLKSEGVQIIVIITI